MRRAWGDPTPALFWVCVKVLLVKTLHALNMAEFPQGDK